MYPISTYIHINTHKQNIQYKYKIPSCSPAQARGRARIYPFGMYPFGGPRTTLVEAPTLVQLRDGLDHSPAQYLPPGGVKVDGAVTCKMSSHLVLGSNISHMLTDVMAIYSNL